MRSNSTDSDPDIWRLSWIPVKLPMFEGDPVDEADKRRELSSRDGHPVLDTCLSWDVCDRTNYC